MARFDWYQATVEAPVRDVLAALADRFPGEWEEAKVVPNGYDLGMHRTDADGVVGKVWWGARHEHPHVLFTGEVSPRGAALLREVFPAHRVARADSCIDYCGPGSYDSLQAVALEVARERGIKIRCDGDHLLTKEGRTLGMGSPKSVTSGRLYDRSARLRALFHRDPVRLAAVPADVARLEIQVRPGSLQAKVAAATVEPLELMGAANWSRELVRRVEGVELPRFQAGKVWRQSDDDRAYAALLSQYGGLLKRKLAELGSWDCVGLQIGHDLAERDSARR